MGQHYIDDFLVQCWPRQIQTTLQITFLGQSCLWSMDQHCTGNCLAQCWLKQTKTTLHMVIFLRKDECVVRVNIAL